MRIKVDITALIASFVVLYCNAGLSGFVKGSSMITLLAYGLVALWIVLVLSNDMQAFKKMTSLVIPVAGFVVFLVMCKFIAPSTLSLSLSNTVKNIMFLLVFVLMFIYYSKPSRSTGRKTILFIWFVDEIISSIYTIYRLEENPMISRILATGDVEGYVGSSVSTAGILGYGSIYGMVFAIIAVYGVISNHKAVKKVFLWLCLGLFAVTIIQAQFFIALVLGIFGIILADMVGRKNEKIKYERLLITLPIVAIIIFAFVSYLPTIIESGVFPEQITQKLKMLYEKNTFDELSATARGVVYLRSLNAIVQTAGLGIVFVGRNLVAGGHSEILDLIANYCEENDR